MSTAVEHGVVVPEPAVKAVEDRKRLSMCACVWGSYCCNFCDIFEKLARALVYVTHALKSVARVALQHTVDTRELSVFVNPVCF